MRRLLYGFFYWTARVEFAVEQFMTSAAFRLRLWVGRVGGVLAGVGGAVRALVGRKRP